MFSHIIYVLSIYWHFLTRFLNNFFVPITKSVLFVKALIVFIFFFVNHLCAIINCKCLYQFSQIG
jgi:hypothetical protein